MKKFILAALAVTAIIWGTTGAFRQSPPQEQLTMERIVSLLVYHTDRSDAQLECHAGSRAPVMIAASVAARPKKSAGIEPGADL
jgi:hypothetical protein